MDLQRFRREKKGHCLKILFSDIARIGENNMVNILLNYIKLVQQP